MQSVASTSAFISYRRDVSWALADRVYEYLKAKNVDVFMDRKNLAAGKFPEQILQKIASQHAFLPILVPGTLNRCINPDDWVRREIEEAIGRRKLVIPLYTSNFVRDDIKQFLPVEIASELAGFDGIELHQQFFDASMQMLLQYLGVLSTETAIAQRKELNDLYAEFYRIRNEYIRFSRSGNSDPNEHNRIISLAQEVCLKVSAFTPKCQDECLGFSTNPGADLKIARQLHDACRSQFEYIAIKWLTPNQVLRRDNPFEADLWGEYRPRNEAALDEAKTVLEKMLRS